MKREEQKIENTWKMEDMYSSDQAMENDLDKALKMISEYNKYKDNVSKNKETLLDYLKFNDEINLIAEKVYVYSNQKYHEDMTNSKYQTYSGKAQKLVVELGSATAFFEPEILEMDENVLKEWLENKEFADYRRYISEILRAKAHTLDKKTEEILAKSKRMASAADNIYAMYNGADIDFPTVKDKDGNEIKITHGNFVPILSGADRQLRKDAFKALYGTYEKMKNTIAATYNANVEQACFYADVRNYPSTRAMYLDESNIPEEVYDNLIEVVHEHMDLMHRYVSLRKKALGVDQLHMYDVYVSLTKEYEQKYTYEQAIEIVKKALAVLGDDYVALLDKGFSERWVDVYENEGKKSGAYSWGSYDSHPYVLMSFNGNIDSVFTLAHEMGHSLHSWYSNHTQPFTYAEYRLFVAEVASTCNEALLIRYLLKHAKEKEEKIFLLNYFLDQFKGTVFRQTMFAEFEKRIHEKMAEEGTLTADGISELYLSINKEYFGPDMISDPQIALEWARIPHFYTPFYVYQYATGFSAAIAISSKILAGEPGIVEKYKQFLSGGCSMDPIDLLKICGVDMTKPEPVEEALDVFASYVEELEKLTAEA